MDGEEDSLGQWGDGYDGQATPPEGEFVSVSVYGHTHTSPDERSNYYWVAACNSAGCSEIDGGNPATLVETTSSITAPGAPNGLTAIADGPAAAPRRAL